MKLNRIGINGSRCSEPPAILIGLSLGESPVHRHFAALGRELLNLGCRVCFVAHGPGADRSYVDERIPILRWPSPRPTHLTDAKFFNNLLTQSRPLALVSQFASTNIMLLVGALRRVPVRVRWQHTVSSAIGWDWPTPHGLDLFWMRFRARYIYRLATHTVANSSATKRDLMALFKIPEPKCTVFWNSLEDPLKSPTVYIPTVSHDMNRHQFVCVGRFAPSKGQDVLIRALPEVVKQRPDVRVTFIGDGRTLETCRSLVGRMNLDSHCVFAGSLPHDEVILRMAGARATIVPSRSEAFGLVNIESMAVRTPVIGSATGGIAEVVRDGLDGFLFPPGDHQMLAQHLLTLLGNDGLRDRMGQYCRSRFLEQFELGRAVRLQAAWLRGLMKAHSRVTLPALSAAVAAP